MSLPSYTLEQVVSHNNAGGCWLIMEDYVVDVKEFLDDHPGGAGAFTNNLNKDVMKYFNNVNHSDDAIEYMESLRVGKFTNE